MSNRSTRPTTARRLAPEDVKRGMYVAIMHEVDQNTPYFCFEDSKVKEFLLLPYGDSKPLKVLDVCIPFVFVEKPHGGHRTLDVRRYRLAQLDTGFARRVVRTLRQRKKRDRKKGG